ncbi:MAG: DUF4145 domain-containing protein [Candidatus Binatus sp.]|uniref:DUF4145 domain-containing protein n=1 Tax=Candidatus Binatus sp. TaxID=2811406 RepID=UPI0027229371|nr:DUF4145 domain-containing protein [Candidatus Binatus sp.]MDO8432079.1 DUF4145 domain-containing protein [Candidatus Binatus sp.]
MNWLSFISSLIKTLAWPSLLLFLVLYFKEPLAELLRNILEIRYKEFRIAFGKKVQEISAEAAPVLGPTIDEAHLSNLLPAKQLFQKIAKLDPSAAVLVAWRHLEQASRRAAQRHGIKPSWQTLKVLASLHSDGRIDPHTYQIFREMRELRNQAAHEDAADITESEAVEFADLAIRLAAKLEEA